MTKINFEQAITSLEETNKEGLKLNHIVVDADYMQKWNERLEDFVLLTFNGKVLRHTLYRKGGIGGYWKDGYMMLIKHVEAFYDDSITKDPKRKPHLESRWCIIDWQGNEKVEFTSFKHGYIVGGQIYSIENKYYNIETGEFYCKAYHSVSSDEYLFLQNDYDENSEKRGVIMINKKDGTYKLFPGK